MSDTATSPSSATGTTRNFRLANVARAPGRGLGRVRNWIHTHRKEAAASAAVAAVGGFALYRRHSTSAAATAADQTDQGAADTSSPAVAGLSGTPDTTGVDYGNQLQDIENQLQNIRNRPAPRTPPPAPRPGQGRFTVHKGDTLAKIAQEVFGSSAKQFIAALRRANPSLKSFGAGDRLDYFTGDTLVIPKAPPWPQHKSKNPRPAGPTHHGHGHLTQGPNPPQFPPKRKRTGGHFTPRKKTP